MDEIREVDVLEEEYEEEYEEEAELPDVLFRVETILDAESQKEASETVRGKLMDVVTWVFIGVCVVLLGVFLWQFLTAESKDYSQIFLMVVLAFAVGMSLYNKFYGQKKAIRRWEEDMGKRFGAPALHLTTEFFERSLCQSVRETEDAQVEGYSAIVRMKESENLFLLNCGRQQWFFVSKKGFTKGTAQEFRAFISEKIGGK